MKKTGVLPRGRGTAESNSQPEGVDSASEVAAGGSVGGAAVGSGVFVSVGSDVSVLVGSGVEVADGVSVGSGVLEVVAVGGTNRVPVGVNVAVSVTGARVSDGAGTAVVTTAPSVLIGAMVVAEGVAFPGAPRMAANPAQ